MHAHGGVLAYADTGTVGDDKVDDDDDDCVKTQLAFTTDNLQRHFPLHLFIRLLSDLFALDSQDEEELRKPGSHEANLSLHLLDDYRNKNARRLSARVDPQIIKDRKSRRKTCKVRNFAIAQKACRMDLDGEYI